MKALVTGGTGFLGGHLIDRLVARGDEVTALIRSPSRAKRLADLGVRLIKGDLADREAMAAAVDGQDVVYHSAALTGAVDEAEFLAANRDGTEAILRAATEYGSPRFVYISSMAAGGPALRNQPISGPVENPVTMYGRSKLAGELIVRQASIPWTILRPPTIYGPRDSDNLLTVFRAARMGIAPMFGDGSMQLSLVHVEDLADGIVRAGGADGVVGGTFYTNHPEIITGREMIDHIGRAMGRRVRLVPLPEWLARTALTATGAWAAALRRKTILRADKANEFYQQAWIGDPVPFITATGWAPEFDAASGLAHTAAWYRQQRLI